MVGMVFGIILIVLFPVWPLWIKVGIWYSLVAFLVVVYGGILFRVLIWASIFIIGFDVWVLPEIFNDDIEWSKSFWPLISIEKNKDDHNWI